MDMVCVTFAFIDGLGGPEMVLIFVLILVLFGGQKLPEFARGMGKSIREFKKAAAGVEEEFKRALEEDERKKTVPAIMPPTPVAALPENPAPDYAPDHTYDEGGPYTDVATAPPAEETKPAPTPVPASEPVAASAEPMPVKILPAVVPPSAPPVLAPDPAMVKNPPTPPSPDAGHA